MLEGSRDARDTGSDPDEDVPLEVECASGGRRDAFRAGCPWGDQPVVRASEDAA